MSTAGRTASAWIIVAGAEGKTQSKTERRFPFYGEDLLIGRDAGCPIRLDHPSVSRLHARIFAVPGGVSIEDLKSTHGTFAAGRRVETAGLSDVAPIDLGPFHITCEMVAPVTPPALEDSGPVLVETDPRSKLAVLVSMVKAFDLRASRTACLGQLLDALLSAVGAERGFLYRCDPGGAVWRVFERAVEGGNTEAPVSETLIAKAARERRPLWLVEMDVGAATMKPDLTPAGKIAARLLAQPPPDWDASVHRLAREHLQSVIVCPLIAGARLSGVLWLDSRARMKSFSREDAELVEAVSRSAAQLLDGLDVREELSRENLRLRAMVDDAQPGSIPVDRLVAHDSPVRESLRLCQRAARTDVSVLLSGETGTGKEVLARYIHETGSRKVGPFVAVNCGALPEGLMESELFGHKKGAFTGATENRAGLIEMANGGTLFLDEVGELSQSSQVKLLRVLQERVVVRVGESETRPVDFRLIAATLRDLPEMVAARTFREDLYYRLNVLRIQTTPLRDRKMDLPLLVDYHLRQLAPRVGSTARAVEPAALERMRAYAWPGNVRELRNVIERALVVEESDVLSEAALPDELLPYGAAARLKVQVRDLPTPPPAPIPAAPATSPGLPAGPLPCYAEALEGFERAYFERLIAELGLNVSALSRRARLTRFTIYRKLEHLGLRDSASEPAGDDPPEP